MRDVSATMASPLEVDVIGDSFDIDEEAEEQIARTRTVAASVLEDDRDRRSSRGAAQYYSDSEQLSVSPGSVSSASSAGALSALPTAVDPLEIELELGLSTPSAGPGRPNAVLPNGRLVRPTGAGGDNLDFSRASSTSSMTSFLFSSSPSAPSTPARPAAPTLVASGSRATSSTPIAARAAPAGGYNPGAAASPSVLGALAGGLSAAAAELPMLSAAMASTPQSQPVQPPRPSPGTKNAGRKATPVEDPNYAALKAKLATTERSLAASERQLEAVQSRLNNWQSAARDALNAVALSPASNERYKHEITEQLQQIMSKIEQVQKVLYINCSFPAISAQAPVIEMHSWTALDKSAWSIRWKPSWSVEVSLEGWHYIPFSLSIRVSGITIDGRFSLKLSPLLDYFWVSFGKDIQLDMNVEVEVTWGIVNMPLQATIEKMVRTGLDDWLRTSLIEPNSMRFTGIPLKGERGVTDEDVQKATVAAEQAMLRTPRASDAAPP